MAEEGEEVVEVAMVIRGKLSLPQLSSYDTCAHTYMLMRDAEARKKEASKVIQTTRQSNTTHPKQSLFLTKMSCLVWDSNPRHSAL